MAYIKNKIKSSCIQLVLVLLIACLMSIIAFAGSSGCIGNETNNPVISILSYLNPVAYGGLQTIEFNISDESQLLEIYLTRDAVISYIDIENSTSFSYVYEPEQIGLQDVTISAKDVCGNMGISSFNFSVIDDTEPVILSIVPDKSSKINPFTLTVVTDEISSCRYSTTAASNFSSMTVFDRSNATIHNTSITGNEGLNSYAIRCSDNSGNVQTSPQIVTIMIDSIPPSINSMTYAEEINTAYTTVSFTTDENASCRYSFNINESFDQMSVVSKTGSLNHNLKLESLKDGSYKVYFLCKDASGNAMLSRYNLSFVVDLLVTAEVILDKDSPLRAGIVQVVLISSKKLLKTPSLSYVYTKTPNTVRQVALTGSGSRWQGYLLVDVEAEKDIGIFSFQGIDSDGDIGTEITSGKSFVIDTSKPMQITDFVASEESYGQISLSWYYDGEDTKHFNVYRSMHSGVTYTDFYQSVEENKFVDRAVIPGYSYYYRVTPVDLSSNEGKLSPEVQIRAGTNHNISALQSPSTAGTLTLPEMIPDSLIRSVNSTLKEISGLILDLETVIDTFSAVDEPKEIVIVEALEIEKSAKQSKQDLESMYEDLVLLLDSGSVTELKEKHSVYKLDIQKIKSSIPVSLEIKGDISFIQEDDKVAYTNIMQEVLGSNSQIENPEEYIKSNTQIQAEVLVTVEAYSVEVEMLDYSIKDLTYISKRISNKAESLSSVMLMEYAPKQVAKTVQEMHFIGEQPSVIKDDPIVKWDVDNFNYEENSIDYYVWQKVDLESLKKTVSLIMTVPQPVISSPENKVTGNVVFNPLKDIGISLEGSSLFGIIGGIIVIVVLAGYYGYLKMQNNPKEDENYGDFYGQGKIQGHSESVSSMIENVHNAIKSRDYQSAKQMYDQIYSLIGALDPAKRVHYEERLNQLYNKLVLMHKLTVIENFQKGQQNSLAFKELQNFQTLFQVIVKDDPSARQYLDSLYQWYCSIKK